MIAQPGAGINGEEEILGIEAEDINHEGQPSFPNEPDESWWSSLLIDEPHIDENMEETEVEYWVDDCSRSEKQRDPSEQWERIKLIYEKDQIVSLKVIGLNKGGVLVENSEISGFVPASHLIEFPAGYCDEDREYYLSCYLDREISVKVIEFEPDKERVVFSERAALSGAGQRLKLLNSLAEGDVIRGTVTNVTSFGAFVDLGGVEGLIHISELSWGRVQHPSQVVAVGEELETIVIDLSEKQGRIALSLKRLSKNPWLSLSQNLAPGDMVDAEISCIKKYGVFARLEDGIEGLIHVSSLTLPEDCQEIDDIFDKGQLVKVKIISIEPEKRRLSLQLECDNPYDKTG